MNRVVPFLAVCGLVPLWLVAHAQGLSGDAASPPPAAAKLQHIGQTFYPNVPTLGAQDNNMTFNASRMVMRNGPCAVTAIKLGYTNSAINGGPSGESTNADVISNAVALTAGVYEAAIEYPLGSRVTRVTFQHAPSAPLFPDTDVVWSDSLPFALPANASYAIQTLVNARSGPVAAYHAANQGNPLPTGSGVVESTKAPAQFGTAGTWPGLTPGAAVITPLLVIGTSTAACHSVLIKGDSHVTGQTDNAVGDHGDANGYVGMVMRMLDKFPSIPPFLCVCIGGNQIQSYGAPVSGVNTVETAAMAYFPNTIVYDWPNDIFEGATPAQTEQYLSDWVDAFRTNGGQAAWIFTAPPQTGPVDGGGSIDGWRTYTGQTIETPNQAGGPADSVVAWIVAGRTIGHNPIMLIDHASGPNGIGGACSAGAKLAGAGDRRKWCSDGIHPFGSTIAGRHPTDQGTITAFGDGNSYNIGATRGFQVIDPSGTGYGQLR